LRAPQSFCVERSVARMLKNLPMLVSKKYFLFCFLFCAFFAQAQYQRIGFERYSNEDGLGLNSVNAISQDKAGYIWIAAPNNGISRYDGYRFQVLKNNPADSFSLRYNGVAYTFADSDGLLWLCTSDGLQLFNAVKSRFESISQHYGIPAAVDSLTITQVHETTGGHLWFISENQGVFLFKKKEKQLRHFFDDPDLARTIISGLAMQNGHLLLLTNKCLYELQENNTRQITFADSALQNAVRPYCHSMTQDRYGQIWVSTYSKGVYVLRVENDIAITQQHYIAGDGEMDLPTNQIVFVEIDAHENVWISARGEGICILPRNAKSFIRMKHDLSDVKTLSSDYVQCFFEDKQNIIWLGTVGGGICKFDPTSYKFTTYKKKNNSINSVTGNDITNIYSLSKDTVLIGTRSNGFSVWDTKANLFTNYFNVANMPNSLSSNSVYGFYRDSQQKIWVATFLGLCSFDIHLGANKAFKHYLNGSSIQLQNLFFVCPLQSDKHLLAGGVGGLSVFNTQTLAWEKLIDKNDAQKNNRMIARCFLHEVDKVWIGLDGKSLACYDFKEQKLTQQMLKFALTNIQTIRSISADSNGTHLWLATDKGLVYFNKQTRKVEVLLNQKDGLPDDLCYGLIIESREKIWISTIKGLSRYSTKSKRFDNYGMSYGLQGNEFSTDASLKLADGSFLFGGSNGFDVFHPAELKISNYSPNVTLNKLVVLENKTEKNFSAFIDQQIVLNPTQNFFYIEYAAINFSHAEKTTYEYKLDGVDNDWIAARYRTTASYTDLDPGEYLFRVKAYNSDGIACAAETTLRIKILPPWFKTWWFKTLMALSLIGGLLWWNRSHIKSIRHEAAIKNRLTKTEMMTLRAQMNPHFIFNSLNSINSFIIDNKTHLASDYLTKFSRLIRLILDNSRSEIISLEKELEAMKLYTLMESIRFNNKFKYKIQIDENISTENIKIPPMTIQPYVENAIWHGIMHKQGDGTVKICVKQPKENELEIVIDDDGIGRAKSAEIKKNSGSTNKSHGLAITQQRLELHNDRNQIETIDKYDEQGNATGTRVVIRLVI
jgi:ligand-binding sensor domain-containing protein